MRKATSTLASKVLALRIYLLKAVPYKIVFLVTGLLATLWFLLRVIPKPSRAAYPCIQAAAPLMSGFVLYLLSFTGSFMAFRKASNLMAKRNYLTASLLIVAGLILGATFFIMNNRSNIATAAPTVVDAPPDGANNPMGEGKGIFPGRVVWAWNPDATNANCNNTPGNAFWNYKNNDTLVIRKMVNQSILELTGEVNISTAWDAIFKNHNKEKHNLERGYQQGEKIFIKINQGTSRWALNNDDKSKGYAWPDPWPSNRTANQNFAVTETGPFVVLNILRQLIHEAGVPQENISVGDPMSHIFKHNFQPWYDEFPKVKYVDKHSGSEVHKRTRIASAEDKSMHYSDNGEVMDEANEESYFNVMVDADYLINVACLKPHKNAGVSFNAKNHFGSITRTGAGHLHPSLISTVGAGRVPVNDGYDKYRVAVDIMGHKYLGRNTMLLIIEGLFGGSEDEVWRPVKYHMEPFNNDWTNSIFMSLDQVAIESVAFDFLRTEFDGKRNPGLTNIYPDWPNWLGADAFLHHASDASTWPEGIVYNPDGDGPIVSLGVHEHWNNPTDKQYSRNLGLNKGIELIRTNGISTVSAGNTILQQSLSINAFPNPFRNDLTVSFTLESSGTVLLELFDLQGRKVAGIKGKEHLATGFHEVKWNAASLNLQPGYYFIRMHLSTSQSNYVQNHKIQLLK